MAIKQKYTVECLVLPYPGAPIEEARPVLRIDDAQGEQIVTQIMPMEEWQPIRDRIAERVRRQFGGE